MQKYLSITITINRLWDQLPPKPKLFFYLFLHNSPHGYSISYYGNRMWTISNGNAANNSIFLFKFSLPWIYIKSKPNHILKGLILLSNYRYFFEETCFKALLMRWIAKRDSSIVLKLSSPPTEYPTQHLPIIRESMFSSLLPQVSSL